MKAPTVYIAAAIAILLGIIQYFFAIYCWSYITSHYSLVRWLFDLGLKGEGLKAVAWPIDFIINIALSIPIAMALVKLRPRKRWLYAVLAVLPGLIWANAGLVGSPYAGQFIGTIALGWIQALLAIPVAIWLVSLVFDRGAPGQTIKSTTTQHAT
ncbi:hypothetical protein [Dyella sp. 20L07]|uniref:hypothetical protein n=1 Tax=Dyella sp. 20L07 TaxID=3384240 RepID=UPI003D28CA49